MKRGYKILQESGFVLLILVILVMTAGIGFVVVPLLLIFDNFAAYAIAAIMGLAMGALVNRFVHDLENLTHHHHAILWMLSLMSAILNFSAVYFGIVNNNPLWSSDLVPLEIAVWGALIFSIGFFVPLFLEMLHLAKKEVRR